MSEGEKNYVKGSLSQVPFPKVLNFVNQGGKTGVLAIARAKKKVHLHFLNGNIVYVTSSYVPGSTLGEFLVEEGKITKEQHEESLDQTRGTGLKQGLYLVEHRYLSPHELYETLHRQVMTKLYWLFEWTDGDFFFKDGGIVEESLRVIRVDLMRLVYTGVRDHMPLDRLPTEFRGRKESFLVRRPNVAFDIETLGLNPAESRVLAIINGQFTLRQVVTLAKMKKRAIYKILYGLFLTGVIGFPEVLRVQGTSTPKAAVKPRKAKDESYEISAGADLIAQAMESVDRIHEEVSAEQSEEAAKSAEPAAAMEQPPASVAQEEYSQMLSSESGENVDAQFGFDEESPDGFSREETPTEDSADDLFGPEKTEAVPREREEWEMDESEELPPEARTDSSEESVDETELELGDFESDTDMADEEPEPAREDEYVPEVGDFSDPEEIFQQATMLMSDARFDSADVFFRRALEMLPDRTEIYAYLGWTLYNSAQSEGKQLGPAEQMIKKGMGAGKNRYQHFLYLGKLYAEEQQYEFAELHFVKALEMNVDCAEAKEMIKRIHSR
jgi:tetratricopeptide (TPR) repeat protein